METLGQFIFRRRKELGLSQAELADRLKQVWPKIDRSEVSKLESDERDLIILYAERLKVLAVALEVDIGDLLRQTEAPPER